MVVKPEYDGLNIDQKKSWGKTGVLKALML